MTLDESAVQRLIDKDAIIDTLYRYASNIDTKNYPELRKVFADDAVGTYGGAAPIHGGDAIVAWIDEATKERSWQHHLLSVYHVDFTGPDEAKTLTYHTSHQTSVGEPDTVILIVARYHDTLRRIDGTWKIVDKVMETGWMERRARDGSLQG